MEAAHETLAVLMETVVWVRMTSKSRLANGKDGESVIWRDTDEPSPSRDKFMARTTMETMMLDKRQSKCLSEGVGYLYCFLAESIASYATTRAMRTTVVRDNTVMLYLIIEVGILVN